MTGQEITATQDNLALTTYLTQIYDVFRSEIPHVKHPKLVRFFRNVSKGVRSVLGLKKSRRNNS